MSYMYMIVWCCAFKYLHTPSYLQHESDPLVFVLDHPGTGKDYFKVDSKEQLDRYFLVGVVWVWCQ